MTIRLHCNRFASQFEFSRRRFFAPATDAAAALRRRVTCVYSLLNQRAFVLRQRTERLNTKLAHGRGVSMPR